MRTVSILLLVLIVVGASLGFGCLADEGPRGPTGAEGAIGPQGEQGEQGEKGDIPPHEWNGTHLRFQNPDGSWGEYTDIPEGAAGPQGDQGPQGEQGPQGDRGDEGPVGPPGSAPVPDSAEVLKDGYSFLVSNSSTVYVTVSLQLGDRLAGSFTTDGGDVDFWVRDPFSNKVFDVDDTTSQDFALIAATDGDYKLGFWNGMLFSDLMVTLDATRYPSIQLWSDS